MDIKEYIPYMKVLHGFYNFTILLLFVYQGLLGIRIRKNRLKKLFIPDVVKKHRRLGLMLFPLSIAGFFSGVTLVYAEWQEIIKYPLHFFNGVVLLILIISIFIISRLLTIERLFLRNIHFLLGLLIISLYLIQIILGFIILIG